MAKLARLTGQQVIVALRKAGFEVLRIKGSHHFLRHPDGRSTVVPVHRSEIIGPGLMLKILRDCELEREEFMSFIK
ncbi:MAG: type II toxin-antitoxin system HicA family toxin [Anaerolineales bacterium]|nr:type II toxin-antitoxin system HicA family toxin [Anaerolineales bacterium]